jgi:hypothetical protein
VYLKDVSNGEQSKTDHDDLHCTGAEGAVVARQILEKGDSENMNRQLGWNAQTATFEDMVKAGIIDPVKARDPCHLIMSR